MIEATPEPASVALVATVTAARYQPAPQAPPLQRVVRVGGVRSDSAVTGAAGAEKLPTTVTSR